MIPLGSHGSSFWGMKSQGFSQLQRQLDDICEMMKTPRGLLLRTPRTPPRTACLGWELGAKFSSYFFWMDDLEEDIFLYYGLFWWDVDRC